MTAKRPNLTHMSEKGAPRKTPPGPRITDTPKRRALLKHHGLPADLTDEQIDMAWNTLLPDVQEAYLAAEQAAAKAPPKAEPAKAPPADKA